MSKGMTLTDANRGYTQFIRPAKGNLRRALLNLLLRFTVKWRIGRRVNLEQVRATQARIDRHAARQALVVKRSPADCPAVAAEWLTPTACEPSRVLLYLHGGAFIARSPAAHAAMIASWCEALQAKALMVDYRLAPEHAWPAAPDDCYAAWGWLLEQGYAASDIVIAGDSAGGNLVLTTLHHIKATRKPMPACAVLLSPFVDFTLSGDSIIGNGRQDPVFTPAFAAGFRDFYITAEHYLDPSASPLFGDFTGLPSMLIQVGSTEMLLDDAVRTAARAHTAGVEVLLEIWERMPHVFQAVTSLPQAREASDRILHFISLNTGWQIATDVDLQPITVQS